MTSRRQSRRVTKTDVDYKEDDNSGPSEDESVPATTKRRKTTTVGQKKVTKRRKGKLSKLPDMPLDVLYEVSFGQLEGIKGRLRCLDADLLPPSSAGSPQDLMDNQGISSRSHKYLVQDRLDGFVFLRPGASRLSRRHEPGRVRQLAV